MIGLVLAAGAGRRLRPYTDTLPKALIAVDGERTVLDLTLRNFAAVELTDAAVIVGYAADQVRARKDELERRYGVTLHLVDNDKALEWNNAYSLWCARDFLTEGVLLANGDTVHPVAVEQILLANRGPDVLLAVDTVKPLDEEEMKVYCDGVDSSRLAAINKALDPAKAAGEYIGLTLIEPAAAAPLTDALRATWERDPQLYYEDGYQELVDRGARVDLQPIGEVSWVEIDNHDDLARAREIACQY